MRMNRSPPSVALIAVVCLLSAGVEARVTKIVIASQQTIAGGASWRGQRQRRASLVRKVAPARPDTAGTNPWAPAASAPASPPGSSQVPAFGRSKP